MSQVDISKGSAIDSVHLIATPSPFPDEYDIVMFKTEGGSIGFCRSTEQIGPGDSLEITADEFGPLCSRDKK